MVVVEALDFGDAEVWNRVVPIPGHCRKGYLHSRIGNDDHLRVSETQLRRQPVIPRPQLLELLITATRAVVEHSDVTVLQVVYPVLVGNDAVVRTSLDRRTRVTEV